MAENFGKADKIMEQLKLNKMKVKIMQRSASAERC